MHGSHLHSPVTAQIQTSGNQGLIRSCTIAAICVATLLVIMKSFAWYITGSVAMLSSLLDSGMDLLMSGINFVAIGYAFKPADEDHRFGHARAQDLAALAQTSFIIYLSIAIAIEAVKKLITPESITASTEGVIVSSIALFLTLGLVIYQKYVFKKTKSSLVHADSTHYITDVLSNISVIIVLVVSNYYDLKWLDPLLGLLLAGYVLISGLSVGLLAFNNLMDKELDESARQEIIAIIKGNPSVKNVAELKTRVSGHKTFIQFDFSMDGSSTLAEAHIIAHELEAKLIEKYPDAEIFIHQEPA